MRKVRLTFIILSLAFLANGHEFWLQPAKFNYGIGEEIKLDFMVGESFTGEFWDLNRHKAEKLELHRSTGVISLVDKIKSSKGSNLTVKADQEGTYLFSLQSNAAYIELEGEKFNDYLKEDGLDYILDERTKAGTLSNKARELYTRFAKVLVQTGNRTDDTCKKNLGLNYEIIPDQNPYTLKAGDHLQCRVLYKGKPAPHTLVKVWNKVNNTTFLQNIYTENDGTIRFPISASGSWMVSSVKMIKSDTTGADYHSFWASLVFGI